MNVYVNRTLNLKKIKYIGLDMDHTLVRYDSREFEGLAYKMIIEKLITVKGYPSNLRELKFDYDLAIRGLVLDLINGNLLKVSRYSAIRLAYHGTHVMDFATQKKRYKSIYIDLSESQVSSVDTNFAISYATLFAQLVDLKDHGTPLPDYQRLGKDVLDSLDESHRDGSLKEAVRKDLSRYIISDPEVVEGLECFRRHGKKIFLLTNSDYAYSKLLLDYAISPHLKECRSWLELFEFIITLSQKPRFFYDNLHFLKINPKDGTMVNHPGRIVPGVYQGGSAERFTTSLAIAGDEILYVGDHIYGDILRLKKDCNWRTALVVEELGEEVEKNRAVSSLQTEIDRLMKLKEPIEEEHLDLTTARVGNPKGVNEKRIEELYQKIGHIDHEISQLITKRQLSYNPHWGEVMRVGNEESYFAYQVERYACIYMPRLSDFLALSPRSYLRARRRPMAHEDISS